MLFITFCIAETPGHTRPLLSTEGTAGRRGTSWPTGKTGAIEGEYQVTAGEGGVITLLKLICWPTVCSGHVSYQSVVFFCSLFRFVQFPKLSTQKWPILLNATAQTNNHRCTKGNLLDSYHECWFGSLPEHLDLEGLFHLPHLGEPANHRSEQTPRIIRTYLYPTQFDFKIRKQGFSVKLGIHISILFINEHGCQTKISSFNFFFYHHSRTNTTIQLGEHLEQSVSCERKH